MSAAALDATTLARTPTVTILDVRCREATDDGALEHATAHIVILPRRGAFTVAPEGRSARRVVADVNAAVLLNAGDGYAVRHPAGGADICTVFAPSAELLDELGCAAPGGRAFAALSRPVPSLTDLRHRRLVARLRRGTPADTLAVEEDAIEALASVAVLPAAARRRPTPGQRRLVVRVQELLNARAASDVSLGSVAAELGVSPFHVSRTFRAVAGVPMHRYLVRLRLRLGVERIMAGEASITALAHELRFADHSHFARWIRRELGTTPTAIQSDSGDRVPAPRSNSPAVSQAPSPAQPPSRRPGDRRAREPRARPHRAGR